MLWHCFQFTFHINSLIKAKVDPWQCFSAHASWICLQLSVHMYGIVWAWLHLSRSAPRFEAVLFSFYFSCLRLDASGWISAQGHTCLPLFQQSMSILLTSITPSCLVWLSIFVFVIFVLYLWYFLVMSCLLCILQSRLQFSQSVAFTTVCICNFITDAPHWQLDQLCMVLSFVLTSQEILFCVPGMVHLVCASRDYDHSTRPVGRWLCCQCWHNARLSAHLRLAVCHHKLCIQFLFKILWPWQCVLKYII